MWKDYSKSYIKNNRASGISVMVAALIAALFLSLICSMFFNFWTYEIEQIKIEEGDWQGRITGDLDEKDAALIRNFANVEKAVINEGQHGKETAIDIYFKDKRTIYEDLPMISARLGLDEDAAEYHSLLLSKFMIHDPQDKEPPLLLTFYMVILIMVSLSLILIIHNSFEISMNARVRQFGIFSSIGATPRQIRTCLLQEAVVLCTVPILAGTLTGAGISFGVIKLINIFATDVAGRHHAIFQYHPWVFVVTIAAAFLTVLFSAWIPARKLGKITPLEAIRNSGEIYLQKKKRCKILSLMFGIEGEMAGNALKAQKKSFRIATISLLLSFLGFTVMMCFFTLSGISTRYTYFERYQDAWDVMSTIKNTQLKDFSLTEEIREMEGVRDSIVYQKTEAASLIRESQLSEELKAIGGISALAGDDAVLKGDRYKIASPIVIMDNASFLTYCRQLGVNPSLDGAIVLNKIWDSKNSERNEKAYVPFVKENRKKIVLSGSKGQSTEVPILSYVQKAPILREEYADYTLVLFMPLSMWNRISRQTVSTDQTVFVRILAEGEPDIQKLKLLEDRIENLIGDDYKAESENRIQEKASNDDLIKGSMVILGGFCGLLAVIGIANVFSNTLGFLRQRKREFAQYLSIGLTPVEMRKMFCIEAFIIAARPILLTLPLTVAAVAYMLKASYLKPIIFLKEAPIVPILIFALSIVGFVSLAYYIGGRRILKCNLIEALRDDTVL